MATYVEQMRCGIVVEHVDAASTRSALETLLQDYQGYRKRAQNISKRDLTFDTLVTAYEQIYDAVLHKDSVDPIFE